MDLLNRLPFFGRKKERETISLIKEQIGVVYDAVSQLGGVFSAIETGDESSLAEKRRIIDDLEHHADGIRREIEENLYSGAFLPMSRSEILGFAEQVDEIADVAQDVSHLTFFLDDVKIDDDLLKLLKEHTEVTLECVRCLKNAIECIDKSEGVKESINRCREGEHNADKIERSAFQLLYKSGHEAKDLILLSKLIELMGQISNYAEDASDTLSLILLMHRP